MVHAVESPVVIVTGGARGIGRAIATTLGATGAKVILHVEHYLLTHALIAGGHCDQAW